MSHWFRICKEVNVMNNRIERYPFLGETNGMPSTFVVDLNTRIALESFGF